MLRSLGSCLVTVDRTNLCGHYLLDMAWDVHRALAGRLQLAALQDCATDECRYVCGTPECKINACVDIYARENVLWTLSVLPSDFLESLFVDRLGIQGCTELHPLCHFTTHSTICC
jgi:hypothetical protein